MDGEMRNLRDFLLVYNKMTEICFSRCAKNLNYRTLTMEEEQCLDSCASKLIRSNHRMMGSYVALMPGMVQRRMADYENLNQEAAKELAAPPESGSNLSDLSMTPEQGPPPDTASPQTPL